MRILLDLDCVLADFVGPCCREWGLDPADVLRQWTPGEYGMNKPLGAALGLGRPLTDEEFWGKLDGKAEFWANLPKLPWCDELVNFVRARTEDWFVVTSPSWCESSYAGKVTWLKREFGRRFNRFAPIPYKHVFAQRGVILVDDCDANCRAFEADPEGRPTGGRAITFPAHHNGLWKYAADPMRQVRAELGYYAGPPRAALERAKV